MTPDNDWEEIDVDWEEEAVKLLHQCETLAAENKMLRKSRAAWTKRARAAMSKLTEELTK